MKKVSVPTIKDVALRAGVSIGTASHVLNNKAVVSKARHDLVLMAAAELNYRPNQLARSLRQRKTNVIGLCVPMISSAYFASMIEAIDELSVSRGHQVMQVLSGGSPQQELDRVESLISRRVDGIVLMPTTDPSASLDLLARNHVPAVIVDRIQHEDRFDLVLLDHQRAMREVVEHLAALGHERLLFVVRNPNLVTTRLRIDMLHSMVTESAGRLTAHVIATPNEAKDLRDKLKSLLRRKDAPTAIITSNSINTLWMLRYLQSWNIRIPHDVSLVAFDEPAWGELISPPLTVVRQPTADIAATAWRLLMERIKTPTAAQRRVMLQNHLVVRASTSPPISGR
ncbi:MAG: transcriptional regulator, LacI family [Microvirga sp.]|jgi:LacI family transcriptional regulator|nr:transcriptional regulator, LacI family [Microvirga sp.]